MLAEQTGQQFLQGGIEARTGAHSSFQLGGDVVQGAGHGRVQGDVHRRDGLGGTHGPEFELVAGEGKGAGTVTVGKIHGQGRQGGNADLHAGAAGLVGHTVHDGVDDVGQHVAQIDGDDGRRGFVGAQTMIVARTHRAQTQGDTVLVHGPEHGGQEDEELGIVQRGLAGIEQVVALGITDGPVVVLAAAVDAGKGLFVEQTDEVMPRRDLVQQVHDEHVVVGGDIGVLVDGRDLELTGGHFIMPGLGRDAEAEQGVLHILHEGHDTRRDGTEVVVLHLLALGRRGAHQRAARQQQVGAQGGQTAVNEEIFLFRPHAGTHEGGRIVAEQAQDAQGLAGKGGDGAHERDLAVQGLARIAVEQGGHMQGATDDEGRDRGIPGRVAAGLEGGAQAAGREGGGIGLAADEHLAREFVDDAAFAGGGQEGVVLFGRQAGHGLEPVGVVRGPLADGPVLHGTGHGIRDVRVKAFTAGDGGLQRAEHGLGQTLLQDVEGENVTTEDGVDIGGRGLVVRMALGDLPDGISSSIHGETPWISFFRRAGKERVTPFTAA